jgi:hypothetical protein
MDQADANAPPLDTSPLVPLLSPPGVACDGSHVEREIPICFALLSEVAIGVERVSPKPSPEPSVADVEGLDDDSPGAMLLEMAEACILLAPGVRLTLSLPIADGSKLDPSICAPGVRRTSSSYIKKAR